jgi:hypothetical protein
MAMLETGDPAVMGGDGHGFAIARLDARLSFKNAEKE